jgi:hypothetical protein
MAKYRGDWFEDQANRQLLFTYYDSVEIGAGRTCEYMVCTGLVWSRLFAWMEANNLQTSGLRATFPKTDAIRRGRLAMLCYNVLRGAARKRGGLWSITEDGKRGEWCEAPREWLVVERKPLDYAMPKEDREGNPL